MDSDKIQVLVRIIKEILKKHHVHQQDMRELLLKKGWPQEIVEKAIFLAYNKEGQTRPQKQKQELDNQNWQNLPDVKKDVKVDEFSNIVEKLPHKIEKVPLKKVNIDEETEKRSNKKEVKDFSLLDLFSRDVEYTKKHEAVILFFLTAISYAIGIKIDALNDYLLFVKNYFIRRYLVQPLLIALIVIMLFVFTINLLRSLIKR